MHARMMGRLRFALAAAGAALLVSLVPSPGRAAETEKKEKMGEGAKEKKMPSYPGLMKMKPTDAMHMMDADHSGNVSREEFMKFYEALYDRLDRDKNQQLTEKEFTDAG